MEEEVEEDESQSHNIPSLKKERNPKYARTSAPPRNELDQHQILKYCPLTTESAMKKIEDSNTIVFIVGIRSDKKKIKDAHVKKMYDIQAKKVRQYLDQERRKLMLEFDALDVAKKIGISKLVLSSWWSSCFVPDHRRCVWEEEEIPISY